MVMRGIILLVTAKIAAKNDDYVTYAAAFHANCSTHTLVDALQQRARAAERSRSVWLNKKISLYGKNVGTNYPRRLMCCCVIIIKYYIVLYYIKRDRLAVFFYHKCTLHNIIT